MERGCSQASAQDIASAAGQIPGDHSRERLGCFDQAVLCGLSAQNLVDPDSSLDGRQLADTPTAVHALLTASH